LVSLAGRVTETTEEEFEDAFAELFPFNNVAVFITSFLARARESDTVMATKLFTPFRVKLN
jgi:hypothetical protein